MRIMYAMCAHGSMVRLLRQAVSYFLTLNPRHGLHPLLAIPPTQGHEMKSFLNYLMATVVLAVLVVAFTCL